MTNRLRMDLGRSLSIGSAEDVGLVTEVSDDLQLAAERLDVSSEGVDLAALQLPLLDARDAGLGDTRGFGNLDLCGVLPLPQLGEAVHTRGPIACAPF